MSLGNYEDAIAYAPKVSMNYWKECVKNYQTKLEDDMQIGTTSLEDSVEELTSYQLLMGQYDKAVSTLESSGHNQSALVIKSV
jgi:hypothetical protein